MSLGFEALTKRQIANEVAARHLLTLADLTMPNAAPGSRQMDRGYARQEAMWVMRQVKRADGSCRYSTTDIGAFLGGRDHTTVLHACRAHERRMDEQERAA